jgi:hypothetical protein
MEVAELSQMQHKQRCHLPGWHIPDVWSSHLSLDVSRTYTKTCFIQNVYNLVTTKGEM